MEPFELTATEAAARLQDGTLTAEALTRSCLERVAVLEPRVRAFVFLDPALAIMQAREADKATARGALHGLPIGVKDMIDTADMPTTHNSPIYQGHRPG
jgi:Asp-tRNA(Asn)/Glu-tRNA(Gln) amidotransferase A subunit family amidase